jgi:hypothetical protein
VALGGAFVFADQSSEDRSAFDPLAVEIRGWMIGVWRAKPLRSMWSPAVVVGAVPGKGGP